MTLANITEPRVRIVSRFPYATEVVVCWRPGLAVSLLRISVITSVAECSQ